MKNMIGNTWENIQEALEDLELLPGIVSFGDVQKNIPWNEGLVRLSMYISPVDEYGNEIEDVENKCYTLDFAKTEDGVKLQDVYDSVTRDNFVVDFNKTESEKPSLLKNLHQKQEQLKNQQLPERENIHKSNEICRT